MPRRSAPEARARAVARATLLGYFGYFFGPPAIGFIAGSFGLRFAFVCAAVMLAGISHDQLWFSRTGNDLVVSGTTYYGTKGLGKVDPVTDTAAEVRGLSFELSGISTAMLATALAEPVQGKAVRIKVAMLDPSTYQVVDVRQHWSGQLDLMTIDESAGSSVIKVNAEHAGIDLLRPILSLYSDTEQRRLYPGDVSLQYMADQVEMRIVWPSREWGRK